MVFQVAQRPVSAGFIWFLATLQVSLEGYFLLSTSIIGSLWPCDAGSMWLSCNTASATTLLSCILYLHHTWPSLEEVAAIEVMRLRHSSSRCSLTVCGLFSVLCPSHKCCDFVLLAANRLLVAHVQCHYSSFQHYWVNGLSDKQAFHLRIGRNLSLSYSSLRLWTGTCQGWTSHSSLSRFLECSLYVNHSFSPFPYTNVSFAILASPSNWPNAVSMSLQTSLKGCRFLLNSPQGVLKVPTAFFMKTDLLITTSCIKITEELGSSRWPEVLRYLLSEFSMHYVSLLYSDPAGRGVLIRVPWLCLQLSWPIMWIRFLLQWWFLYL